MIILSFISLQIVHLNGAVWRKKNDVELCLKPISRPLCAKHTNGMYIWLVACFFVRLWVQMRLFERVLMINLLSSQIQQLNLGQSCCLDCEPEFAAICGSGTYHVLTIFSPKTTIGSCLQLQLQLSSAVYFSIICKLNLNAQYFSHCFSICCCFRLKRTNGDWHDFAWKPNEHNYYCFVCPLISQKEKFFAFVAIQSKLIRLLIIWKWPVSFLVREIISLQNLMRKFDEKQATNVL